MSKPTGTNIGTNLVIAALGTAMIAPIEYDFDTYQVPLETMEYKKLTLNSWEGELVFSSNQIDGRINNIKSFSENLLKNSNDIDPEILQVVSDSYWDLI